MKKYNLYLFAIVFLCSLHQANAQSNGIKHSKRYYAKHPVWIEMMAQEHANYEETIKAFKLYWKDKELPKEAFGNDADSFEKEIGLVEKDKEEKEKKKLVTSGYNYASEVRAFKGWLQSNAAWVKTDGTIMTEKERQDIVTKQQLELKEIELKNGKK